MKNRSSLAIFTTILSVLAYIAFSPQAQAVVPAPDGGYPGANTAEGQSALLSLTTGSYNTAVGILALRSDTTGSFNTALGAGALGANTASENTATGVGALLGTTNGGSNTANGAFALVSNTIGMNNTAIGDRALQNNISGQGHTAVGSGALMHADATGSPNTAVGAFALMATTFGAYNTAVGGTALVASNGFGNTAVGFGAGSAVTSGENNLILGEVAGSGITSASNTICIGTAGNNVDNACYIGNIFMSTSSGGIPVLVNTNGRLGTTISSARFKEEIKPIAKASEELFALKPVSFRYKKTVDPEGDGKSQFGLVAEEVEKVNPDLVVRDKEGKPYSVRYDQVNAMLLNEFLKEHRKVDEQQASITRLKQDFQSKLAEQQKQIKALTAGLEEVSAQLELNKPAPRTVLNK
jgi:hypothetical protein